MVKTSFLFNKLINNSMDWNATKPDFWEFINTFFELCPPWLLIAVVLLGILFDKLLSNRIYKKKIIIKTKKRFKKKR